jgi:nucleotide-binding universal stress UspA family protein
MVKLSINFKNIRKILVPTDGSDYSVRAAEYGVDIAKMLSAQIVVVYVIDQVVIDQISKATERDSVERELKENGQRYVNYVLSLAEKEGVKSSSLLAKGTPYEQIVHLARELNIDLIVMGTYGRRGTERVLIGSVAQRVIEYAPCPVLVIK